MRLCILRVFALTSLLTLPAVVWAQALENPRALPTRPPVEEGSSGADAGRQAALSREDQEVVDNLDLLEHLEESAQLDLLLELSRDD